MRTITTIRYNHQLKRKKLFERDGLRMWLGTRWSSKKRPVAHLELERLKLGTHTVWQLSWSGTVNNKVGAVVVQHQTAD